MTCNSTLKLGDLTLVCEMTGHTKSEAHGPTHRALIHAEDGTPVVMSWPTRKAVTAKEHDR